MPRTFTPPSCRRRRRRGRQPRARARAGAAEVGPAGKPAGAPHQSCFWQTPGSRDVPSSVPTPLRGRPCAVASAPLRTVRRGPFDAGPRAPLASCARRRSPRHRRPPPTASPPPGSSAPAREWRSRPSPPARRPPAEPAITAWCAATAPLPFVPAPPACRRAPASAPPRSRPQHSLRMPGLLPCAQRASRPIITLVRAACPTRTAHGTARRSPVRGDLAVAVDAPAGAPPARRRALMCTSTPLPPPCARRCPRHATWDDLRARRRGRPAQIPQPEPPPRRPQNPEPDFAASRCSGARRRSSGKGSPVSAELRARAQGLGRPQRRWGGRVVGRERA